MAVAFGSKAVKDKQTPYWWKSETAVACPRLALKPGEPCPHCDLGILAYDSLFNLVCPRCQHVASSGAFT